MKAAEFNAAGKGCKKTPMRPRKSLGQHFLNDTGIRDIIIGAADISRTDVVLEVGPGQGVLTSELVKKAGRVIAVEIDAVLAERLKSRFSKCTNLEIINADILRVDLREIVGSYSSYKVVANIPYYITSPILHLFIESECKPASMVVMMQKEVADAVLARPGKMSSLSVSMQMRSDSEKICDVSPQCFYPPPKVESAVVKFILLDKPRVDAENLRDFIKVVHAGFDAPRKQLRNSLAQGLKIGVSDSTRILSAAGIDSSRRAETLSLREWDKLYFQVIRYPAQIKL